MIPDRRALARLGLLLLAVGVGSTLLGLWFPHLFRPYRFGVDLDAYRTAGQRFMAGQDIYFYLEQPLDGAELVPTRYLYPPLTLLPLLPLGLLPARAAGLLWAALSAVLWLGCVRAWSVRLLGSLGLGEGGTAAVLGVALLYYPFLHHLGVGQLDLLVLALLTFGLLQGERRPHLAGLALGAACLAKVYPLLLLPLLAVANGRRLARTLITAVACVLAGVLLTFLLFDRVTVLHFVQIVLAKEAGGNAYVINQGLIASLQRLGVPLGAWIGPRRLASAGALLAVAVGLRRLSPELRADPVVPHAAFIFFYAAVSSYFWVQQYVLLLPVILWCLARFTTPAVRFGLPAVLVVQFLVLAPVPLPLQDWLGRPLLFLLQQRYVLACLLLAAVFVAALRHHGHATPEAAISASRDPAWRGDPLS